LKEEILAIETSVLAKIEQKDPRHQYQTLDRCTRATQQEQHRNEYSIFQRTSFLALGNQLGHELVRRQIGITEVEFDLLQDLGLLSRVVSLSFDGRGLGRGLDSGGGLDRGDNVLNLHGGVSHFWFVKVVNEWQK